MPLNKEQKKKIEIFNSFFFVIDYLKICKRKLNYRLADFFSSLQKLRYNQKYYQLCKSLIIQAFKILTVYTLSLEVFHFKLDSNSKNKKRIHMQ